MKHNHTQCEHKEVKYCQTCSLVYCHSCDKEFVIKLSNFTTIPWGTSNIGGNYGTGTTNLQFTSGTSHLHGV